MVVTSRSSAAPEAATRENLPLEEEEAAVLTIVSGWLSNLVAAQFCARARLFVLLINEADGGGWAVFTTNKKVCLCVLKPKLFVYCAGVAPMLRACVLFAAAAIALNQFHVFKRAPHRAKQK